MSDAMNERPGIRWPGIVWGLLLALAAGAGLAVLAAPDAQAVAGWIRPMLFGLRPEWFPAVVPLCLGLLVIALGAVWTLQRRRRATAAPAETEPAVAPEISTTQDD